MSSPLTQCRGPSPVLPRLGLDGTGVWGMPAQWTVNGRFLSQPVTGVQRYAREILTSLDAQLTEDAMLRDRLKIELLLPPDAREQPALQSIGVRQVGPLTGHAWEQLVLPLHAGGGLISLCNTGPVLKSRQIVCIHDLNTRIFPESYSRTFRLVYRVLTPLLLRRATQVATVSNFSASLMESYGLKPRRGIMVIPNGHEHTARWKPEHTVATASASGPDTIVLLGSNAPHKNVGLILGMADRLADEGFRIALVGSCDPRVFASGKQSSLPDNVIALGRLSDDALAALLQDSLCLAFPSFVEGFGLPPLEAMSLGCPVVASDRTSLPEVCGTAALYADPEEADAWTASFRRLRCEEGLRHALVKAGREQAMRFSWNASARLYLELMVPMDAASVMVHPAEPAKIA